MLLLLLLLLPSMLPSTQTRSFACFECLWICHLKWAFRWKPFTLDCRNKHIYSIHQRDICSLSPFRYSFGMSSLGLQASDRAIYMEHFHFSFSVKLSYALHYTHTYLPTGMWTFYANEWGWQRISNKHTSIDAIQRFLLTRNSYKKSFKWTETEDHCCGCQRCSSVSFVVVDTKRYIDAMGGKRARARNGNGSRETVRQRERVIRVREIKMEMYTQR